MVTVLAACASGIGGTAIPKGSLYAPPAFQDAICNNTPAKAYEVIANLDADTRSNNLLMAYALEQRGHAVRARNIYARLAKRDARSNADAFISLKCGRLVHFSGPIHTVAGQRLAVVSQTLALLDADLAKQDHLHAGLGPTLMSKVNVKAKKPSGPTLTLRSARIELPQSASKRGQWFSHLASYNTDNDAQKYMKIAKTTYKVLADHLILWEMKTAKSKAWRLGVRSGNWSDADKLCVTIKASGAYCRVIDTRK